MIDRLAKLTQAIALVVILSLVAACQDPRLASDQEAEDMDEAVPPVAEATFEEIRQSVIGQKFESLTLGSRMFSRATVSDINDEFIKVSHDGGVDEVPWSEVPEEVQKRWGYDPSGGSLLEIVTEMISEPEKPSAKSEVAEVEKSETPPTPKPVMSPQQRALEIRQKEQMMNAQLEGIKTLESDLSRHTIQLNSLRAQLQSTRALLSSQRSGGVRVERIGGESTVVDRKSEARQLEAQIKVEEQLVAQLSKSLQAANQQYQTIRMAVERLRRE